MTLLAVGHACVDVYQGSVAALVPFFVLERSYDYATVAGVVLAASILSSITQPVFGLLTDRRPLPWLIPSSTLVGGAGIAVSGLAGSYALTLLFVAISGVGVAAYHPESARIARIASGGSHAAMGWFSVGGNIGFALAPIAVTAVVADGGLRATPLLILPTLVGAVSCLPVLRTLAERTAAGRADRRVDPALDDRRSFLRLSLAVACRSIVFVGLSTFVALHVQQGPGTGPAAGAAALLVLFLGGAFGSILGGTLAGRWERVALCRWSYLAAVVAVAGVVFVPGPGALAFVALASVGLHVPLSLQVTLGQDYLPSRVGTASGITLGLTISIGGITSPLVGRLADLTSLQVALTPLIVVAVLTWVLFRGLPEPALPPGARRTRPPQPSSRPRPGCLGRARRRRVVPFPRRSRPADRVGTRPPALTPSGARATGPDPSCCR